MVGGKYNFLKVIASLLGSLRSNYGDGGENVKNSNRFPAEQQTPFLFSCYMEDGNHTTTNFTFSFWAWIVQSLSQIRSPLSQTHSHATIYLLSG